jgi:protein involved in polysaccharide export with SLBB domain
LQIHRRDDTTLSVDLLRYYATGDLDQNPYLRDGDAIYVPAFSLSERSLLFTRAQRPKLVDYRDGDRLTDLLRIVGPDLLEEGRVRVIRREPGGNLAINEYAPSAIIAGTSADPLLRPLDQVQVVKKDVLGTASALGEVTRPDVYPIVVGETTLRDLVEAAGGIAPNGLLRAAYLERRGAAFEAEGLRSLESIPDPIDRAALIELETFENARLSDLSFGSRQYMVREMLQFQRVSIDFAGDSIPAVPLRNGDRFVVPRDPDAVLVIGQVKNPGYIPYVPDANVDYYLNQAGGLGPAATNIYVREAGSGLLRSPGDEQLRSGDYIFVDRSVIADTESLQSLALQEQQLDFQQERERADNRFQYIQTGLALIGTAISVVTTYLLISQEN